MISPCSGEIENEPEGERERERDLASGREKEIYV